MKKNFKKFEKNLNVLLFAIFETPSLRARGAVKDVAKPTTLSAFHQPISSLKLHQKPIAAPLPRES